MIKFLIKYIKSFFALCCVLAVVACANRGTPQGGEKDVDPPVIIRTIPENYTTNFKGTEIRIYFDEYVKLKNLQKQLIVSPPMEPNPVITPMSAASKYITIKISDTLQANTTYALNFGNSIVDNNEENPYPYYRYVFSTGSYIDSLSVSGQVIDAKERITDKFVSVMLYEVDTAYTDSIIYKQKPKYITNTLDSTTTFIIENIKAGTYKLIALKEESSNFTFQQKTDKIGFVERFIQVPTDSLFTLKLFKEETDFKALRPKQVAAQRIIFPFEGNPEGVDIKILDTVPDDFEYKISKDKKTDSLYYWYKPKLEKDSTLFLVTKGSYQDTLKYKFMKTDIDSLVVNGSPNGVLEFTKKFAVEGSIPLVSFDKTLVNIINKDSVEVPFTTSFKEQDNSYVLDFEKQEVQQYKIRMLPEAVKDFYGNTNDTLNFQLSTKLKSDYGNLRVTLANAKLPLIVQLVDDKGDVKYEQYTDSSNIVDFTDIAPRNYFLRAIFDTNENKVYDTGSFLNKVQPERVSYFPTEIEIRSNFDYVETFTLLD